MIKRKKYNLAEIERKLFQQPQKREMPIYTVVNNACVKGGQYVTENYRKTIANEYFGGIGKNADYYKDLQYFDEYLEGCGF